MVSPRIYYYIILQICCSNTLKMLLHIVLNIQDDEADQEAIEEQKKVRPSYYY
jgi:hypothetical protein